MDLVIIILGILYLSGLHVGKVLAICSIVEGVLIFTSEFLKTIKKNKKI